MTDPVLQIVELGMHWPTLDPFLFCAHHLDAYPAATADGGPAAPLDGRTIGSDFSGKDGWNMYHGSVVPGFPQHPHRGFETVTYARQGFIDHSDSLGATARFGGGDVQWMTAGRGVVHSEMFPLLRTDAPNPVELFQIWLNLPAADKLVDPYFTMLWDEDVPKVHSTDRDGRDTTVTVIAGRFGGATPPAPPPNSWAAHEEAGVAILHFRFAPGATHVLAPIIDPDTSRVLYLFDGTGIAIGEHRIANNRGVVLASDTEVTMSAGDGGAEALLLQGRPIGEPVAQYGPFVMNTRAEIDEAFADYRRSEFGGWPWPSDDPIHGHDAARFARHADGRLDAKS